MKKKLSLFGVSLFLLLCLLPGLGMLFVGESPAAANEILSSPPKLQRTDGSFNWSVLSDFSDYFADRFAFGQQLVTVWSRLNAGLLRISAEEQVVLGRDGWLYYSDTLNDYAGLRLSDEELRRIAENLKAIQTYAESRGAQFLFTVAPNKNSLYPEHMPARFPSAHHSSNIRALEPLLQEAGVAYADLFPLFSQERALYYKTDSHWTAQGAALAADRLLQAMGKPSAYADGGFAEDGLHSGDLYEMLYPAAGGAEPELVYTGRFSYTPRSDPRGGDAITIQTENPGANGRLLCWRDSFGSALYPYLADSFGEALFSRAVIYDFTHYDLQESDLVLIEIAERNLPRLAADCALFPTN